MMKKQNDKYVMQIEISLSEVEMSELLELIPLKWSYTEYINLLCKVKLREWYVEKLYKPNHTKGGD
jgi:hypothetical protein